MRNGVTQDLPAANQRQLDLWNEQPSFEDPEYLSQQLITYIGNKRSRLGDISASVEHVKRRLGKARLRVFDVFSGSGVVSRLLKAHASFLATNDFEDYAAVISRCYLSNTSEVDTRQLLKVVDELNEKVAEGQNFDKGLIQELYSPEDDENIRKGERVFYTNENARRLDDYRRLIHLQPPELHDLLLGPLLSEASVHANTAGVFKGFYKNRTTGVGQFGGTGKDALKRIKGTISLSTPILSRFECEYLVLQEEANIAARKVCGIDLAYIDPPYNQHPYGANYFMLNLLLHYSRPHQVSSVSGIPKGWRRSGYNVKAKSHALLKDLFESLDASFLLISFNNEGFIRQEEMCELLESIGKVDVFEAPYNAFRGSRNFDNRPLHVIEQLFLVEKR